MNGTRQVDRRWAVRCDCGRLVETIANTPNTAPGVWIRCAGCGSISWATDYCATDQDPTEVVL